MALGSCGPETPPPPDALTVTPAAFAELPGWTADNVAEALPALSLSCDKLRSLPANRDLGIGGTVGDWQAPCAALAAVPAGNTEAARAYLETWFTPLAASNNGERQGLFTGYYEPELRGSKAKEGHYAVPLYRRPKDLVQVDLGLFSDKLNGERIAGRVVDGHLKPFENRERIEGGALAGKGLELLWVDDPVEAFFLQIQGSGRVALDDGRVLRVGFDGQNGHKYVPIGRELVARGALEKDRVSMQAIRAWLKAHPEEATAVMNLNPSYVFFRELAGDGPNGAQGVPLTPGRSLAVDRKFLPLGLPVWLDAEDPLDGAKRLRRLMVAQDTGGAIRGPVRGDVFWGHGDEAEERAGRMKSKGRYWLLVPKAGRAS